MKTKIKAACLVLMTVATSMTFESASAADESSRLTEPTLHNTFNRISRGHILLARLREKFPSGFSEEIVTRNCSIRNDAQRAAWGLSVPTTGLPEIETATPGFMSLLRSCIWAVANLNATALNSRDRADFIKLYIGDETVNPALPWKSLSNQQRSRIATRVALRILGPGSVDPSQVERFIGQRIRATDAEMDRRAASNDAQLRGTQTIVHAVALLSYQFVMSAHFLSDFIPVIETRTGL